MPLNCSCGGRGKLQQTTATMTPTLTKQTTTAICVLLGVGLGLVSAGPREYCQLDTFKPVCQQDEVILMTSAWYGRIKLGQCLNRDYFVGCKADVLAHLDERCSGRQKCEVSIPDATLNSIQPCPKDLVAHLEADYTCVKVLSDATSQSRCRNGDHLEASAPSGYLSSLVADNQGLGTRSCPWVIRVKPGQQVRLVLMDFSAGSDEDGQDKANKGQAPNVCRVYAHVRETINGQPSKEHVVCSGLKRETTVYTSKTNVATVLLVSHGPDTEDNVQPQFLIRYEAIGCPDPEIPKQSWQQRDADKVDVMCNHTVRSWHLICKGTEWVGETGTCSDSPWNDEQTVSKDRLLHFPNGILIAVMIGVALGIFLGFVLLSVIIMRRRRRDKRRREAQVREENSLLGCNAADNYKLQQQPIYLERMDPDHILAVCPEHGTKVDMPLTSLPRMKNSAGFYETTKATAAADNGMDKVVIQEPYYREFAPCIDVDLTKNTRTLPKSSGASGNMRTNLDITDVC